MSRIDEVSQFLSETLDLMRLKHADAGYVSVLAIDTDLIVG